MRKIRLALLTSILALTSIYGQNACSDLNGYVSSKNIAGTGYYTLVNGMEEKASQTYHYAGPGRVSSVRIYGNYPGMMGGVPLRVGIYDIDANGRPTTLIQSTNATWWWFDNIQNYITVNFGGGGVYVDHDFAISVEIRNASPWGNTFQVQYTGDGEGLSQDYASLAGTSTGNNWSSAMTNFSKDGDFYIVPRMTHYITPAFEVSTSCAALNAPIAFSNTTAMTTDSMFNTIGLAAYSGTNNYYTWDFGDGSPFSNAINPTHAYAVAGSYTVTLTCVIDGWNNDCSYSYSSVVSVGLGLTNTVVNATCYGNANGSITVNGTGGVAPYSYSTNGITYQSSNLFSNLAAGTYTIYIKDNLGCTSTATASVTQPSAILILNILSTNSSCGGSDGALLISASGGTGTLQYQINGGGYQTSGQFTGLSSDFYLMEVMDANGCTVSTNGAVSDQGAPSLTVVTQTNVSCNNGNDAMLVITATGGSGILQYSIDGGTTWQTNGNFNGLSAGVYQVMVEDATGCSHSLQITISEPNPIVALATSTNVTCNGGNDGTITVSAVSGGTGTYTYSLNNVAYQSSNVFTGLAANNYTVYAKDIAGCIGTYSVTVTQPSALAATISIANADCHGAYTGGITVNATGGAGSYLYSLDGENFQPSNVFDELVAGTYAVTIKDMNGCELIVTAVVSQPSLITAAITTGSATCGNATGTMLVIGSGGSGNGYTYSIDGTNFQSSGAFGSLPSDNYTIVVKDGSGCYEVFTTSIIDANGPVITSNSHTNISCNEGNDGTITVNTVTGGTGTLSYSVNGTDWQTSNVFNSLEAGVYSLLVQDANGCIGQVTVTLSQPNPILVTTSVIDLTCHDDNSGSVVVNAAGGAGTLAYSIDAEWPYQSSNTFTGLGAGTFLAVVRDAAGCTGDIQFTVNQPAPIFIGTSVLNVYCHGDNTGAIHITASGGTGALEYSLDGITYQSSASFTAVSAGTYTVYVRDANGCVQTLPAVVTEPSTLSVSSSVSNVVCAGGNDGVIDLSVHGGVTPYSFDWSNGPVSEDNFNLAAGNYSITVTDANGCVNTQSFVITQPANPLIVNSNITDASSQTSADGSIDLTTTGGTGPYSYVWSNGATTEDITNITPGVYTVNVTDVNGCVTSGVFVVSYTIGIDDVNLSTAISLYPNPAHENLTIDAGDENIDRVEMLDVLGQVVVNQEPNSTKTVITTDNLSQGVYFVRVYINDEVITKRIEVSK